MNKKYFQAALFILINIVFFARAGAVSAEARKDFRAVWVSTVINLDYPSKKGLASAQLKSEADAILNRAADIGLNAVMLQVRPAGDAFYKSELFPWSEYLTGSQGAAPDGGFDPLRYWTEAAHERGLELHAWINPYRVSHSTAKRDNVSQLSADNAARRNPAWAVPYKDGGLYYDPGLPETKKLIIDGVAEILKNYDVDGIHLDDYFYPGVDFNDAATYAKYGGGLSLADWRRENVNELIRGIQKTVRELKPGASFGVSPFAIWMNRSSDERGSDTRGMQAYTEISSDSRRWVKEGWLDYICPQIYWHADHETANYVKLLDWWIDVCDGTGVALYVGHAAYREEQGEDGYAGETVRQLKINESRAVDGSIFFRFAHLKGALGDRIKAYYAGGSASVSAMFTDTDWKQKTLSVERPSGNITVNSEKYYILGASDPDAKLTLNGEDVTARNPDGFFGAFVTLSLGKNELTFTQPGRQSVTRVITYQKPAAAAPEKMTAAAVTDAFPRYDEYLSPSDTVGLRCSAPNGAKVTATFAGRAYELTERNAGAYPSGAMYKTSYYLDCPVPSGDVAAVADLGRVTYKMVYDGKEYTAASAANVYRIGPNAPFYATVTSASAWTYADSAVTNGPVWEVVRLQRDRITAITKDGAWTRLATGQWVESQNVSRAKEASRVECRLSEPVYDVKKAGNLDVITWTASVLPVTKVTMVDPKTIKMSVALATGLPAVNCLKGAVVGNVKFEWEDGAPVYIFEAAEGEVFEGYYVTNWPGETRLNIVRKRSLSGGDKPLAGFKFVIDAGHGNDDNGALGPLGKRVPEKDLNLSNAVKLAERLRVLGAETVTVRDSDVFYTLQERAEISRANRPDLFISIHANSVAETTDSTKINGLTVWYRNENGKNFADFLFAGIYGANPLTNRAKNTNRSNLYVCRPFWTPSVIIETSFMCNVDDFSWLIRGSEQDKLAAAVAERILEYYK